jgi:hypothetical protein
MRAYKPVPWMFAAFVLVVAGTGCKSSSLNTNGGTGGQGTGGNTGGAGGDTGGSGAVSGSGGGAGWDGSGGTGGAAGAGGRPLATPSQHRASAVACANSADASFSGQDGAAPGPVNPDGGGWISCSTASSCPACANGLTDRCLTSGGGGSSGSYCGCDQCSRDQDCGATNVCTCEGEIPGEASGVGNICVSANCRVDADCGPGGFCSPTWVSYFGRLRVDGYYCHTPKDQCGDDSDCPASTRCSYSVESAQWVCFNAFVAG